ncbi:MAG: methyltransferase domain-containing protein [Deltaproteobacteria bacterium]|jgi:chemotaxis protein methyltransferase CheR|nr:methyltransferase domain-containing protein [Deltaproteobacteria bacterium]
MIKISESEIAAYSKYILEISGIFLNQSKGYLLETRLKNLVEEYRSSSFSALLNQIKQDNSQKLKKRLIDAISTNETFFFRDNVPFDLMRNKIIPDIIDLRRKQNPAGTIPIKIWSAACSTGQEVYSIIITLLELQSGMGRFENSILGTDISGDAVAKASYAQYNSFEVERGLPSQTRQKYFQQSGNGWRVKDEIRSMARFEIMNLMRPFPANIGSFDIVFCRNVAIYFQNHDKVALFQKIARSIAPGGALIVGGSESLTGIAPDFVNRQYLKGNYYTLKRDENIQKQSLFSVTSVNEQPAKKPPRIKRKTVYDRKRVKPAVSLEKKLQEEKTKRSPSIKTKTEPVTRNIPIPVAPEKPIKEIQEKTSLLASVQSPKEQRVSLIGNRGNSQNTKGSLLANIAQRNEKDKKGK